MRPGGGGRRTAFFVWLQEHRSLSVHGPKLVFYREPFAFIVARQSEDTMSWQAGDKVGTFVQQLVRTFRLD